MAKDKPTKHDHLVRETVTYKDYAKLTDEGARYEINNGQLEAMTPGPEALHQFVLQEIGHCMRQTCSHDYIILLAPIDLILAETELRQPDLVMIHRDRLGIITRRGIEGPPDLVVEVLSASSAKRDRQQKLLAYARYQIPEYWIVDIKNELLEQYLLAGNQYHLSEIYKEDDLVCSGRIPCVSFTMRGIMNNVPDLPNF